jgi:UDP-glucose 4-epimerase
MRRSDMRYLVTGGAGFVGSHLVDALVARGESVLILDDLSTGRLENIEHVLDSERVEFIEGSATAEPLVDECMRSVDVCFHLASAVGVELIVGRTLDSFLGTVRGSDIVISAAARHDRKLLITSSSEVYGKGGGAGPLSENSDRVLGTPFVSRWSYSTAKAFGEALVASYVREWGSNMVVVRLFNTVGPRQTSAYGMVLPRFVRQALTGDDITVYADGRQSRCFCHVLDAVDAILLLAGSHGTSGRAFNVGSSAEILIIDLARKVIANTGSRSRIRFVPYEEAFGEGFEEPGRRVPDTAAIREATGWQPARTLDDAINDVVASERAALATRGTFRRAL